MPFVPLPTENSLIACSFKVRKFITNYRRKQSNFYIPEKEGKMQVTAKSLVLQILLIKKKSLNLHLPQIILFLFS